MPTKTLEATLAPPTAHKEHKLCDLRDTYRETAGLDDADQERIEAARALLQDVSLLSQPEHSGDAWTQI